LDDVDAVRAQRRSDGRGRGCLAGRQLQGQDDADFLGHEANESFLTVDWRGERGSGRAQAKAEPSTIASAYAVRERTRRGDNTGMGRPGAARSGDHSFSTWRKSSSTGVSRPKMLTRT